VLGASQIAWAAALMGGPSPFPYSEYGHFLTNSHYWARVIGCPNELLAGLEKMLSFFREMVENQAESGLSGFGAAPGWETLNYDGWQLFGKHVKTTAQATALIRRQLSDQTTVAGLEGPIADLRRSRSTLYFDDQAPPKAVIHAYVFAGPTQMDRALDALGQMKT